MAPARGSGLRFALAFLFGLILPTLQTLVLVLSGHAHLNRVSGANPATLSIPLLSYLALACREEVAFRSYPLRRLDTRFGPWVAQFSIALVFALEHVAGGTGWVNALLGATVGSILFGMAALATRGLAVPVGLHAAWNFGQWVLGGKETPGLWRSVTDEGWHTRLESIGMAACVVPMAAATFGFWRYGRRIAQNVKGKIQL